MTVNNVEIAYEFHGPADGPVIAMVQGLSMPLNAWPPAMIERLTAAGYRILTFDNRDIGESQTFDRHGVPNLAWAWFKSQLRLPINPPYTLHDMAADVAALLARLDIRRAHILGVSMGGMIAQRMAIDHPARCASLTSIMSTTGNRRLPKARGDVIKHMLTRPASDNIEDRIRHSLATWRLISSPGFEVDFDYLEQRTRSIYARGVTRGGVTRQMLAIAHAKNRVRELRQLDLPTLVIHGKEDPLVPVSGGVDTANAIPGARLEIIEGMGHDLPLALMDRLTGLIVAHVRDAEQTSAAA